METKYKLKPEARQFFGDKYHTQIGDLKLWKSTGIPIELLDEVELVYVQLGHERDNSSSLCGWSLKGPEAHFHFTIKVRDIDNTQYQEIDRAKLIDEIQKVTNRFFKNTL